MSTSLPCGVCGLPIERHTVELLDGVAHAVVREDARHVALCSLEAGCHQGLQSEIRRMRTIVRSLRNRSSRAFNQENFEKGDALEVYAEFIRRELNQLVDRESRWYERLNRVLRVAQKEHNK